MLGWARRHFWLSLGVVVIVSISGVAGGWLPLDRVGRAAVAPFGAWLNDWGTNLGNKLAEWGQLGNLTEENQQLSQENAELQRRVAELQELELENQQLRELANFKPPAGWRSLGAEIINASHDGIRQLMRINRGSDDGLKPGQPVLGAGHLIGVIGQVEPGAAEVILATDGEFRALASSQNHRSTGIVIGTPPSGLTFERVPQEQKLERGEAVVTSGLDGAFPPGLRLGEVATLAQASGSIFQSAQLKPPFESAHLRVVSVLIR